MSTLRVPLTKEDHIQGNETAFVTLIEYGDYQCRYCGTAFTVIKEVQHHFSKKLKFAFRNFPLEDIHPYARIAAEIAEFAEEKGHFWEMHDLIYENQEHLGMPLLIELTQTLGLPVKDLEVALENETFLAKIQKDCLGGVRSGVKETPTFFINENRYKGKIKLNDLIQAIDSILVNQK